MKAIITYLQTNKLNNEIKRQELDFPIRTDKTDLYIEGTNIPFNRIISIDVKIEKLDYKEEFSKMLDVNKYPIN